MSRTKTSQSSCSSFSLVRLMYFLVLLDCAIMFAACSGPIATTPPATRARESSGRTLPPSPTTEFSAPTPTQTTVISVSTPNLKPGDNLLVSTGRGFKVNPDWQVESAEYTYRWSGMTVVPLVDFQHIVRSENGFSKAGAVISPDKIRNLVTALGDLYPIQWPLGGYGHTDDYPSWLIELTGQDGQDILIYSVSTDNPGSGPWNVLYRGQLYAQFDGAAGSAISDLFRSREVELDATVYGGGREEGRVYYSTLDLLNQAKYGFRGLLPLSDGFEYVADPVKKQLRGQIYERLTLGWAMQFESKLEIEAITLNSKPEQPVPCELIKIEGESDGYGRWEFTCAIEDAIEGKEYGYPIHVQASTEDRTVWEFDGGLFGRWGTSPDATFPVPQEIRDAVNKHPIAKQLYAEHNLIGAKYNGDTNQFDPSKATLSGELVWSHKQEPKYTISARFVLQDGELMFWDLDQNNLQEMTKTIFNLALTRRLLQAYPDTTVNLYFATDQEFSQVESSIVGAHFANFRTHLAPCGPIPGINAPGDEKLLRAFSFDRSPYSSSPDFVLVGDTVLVANFELESSSSPVRRLMLPEGLAITSGRSFERIFTDGFLSRTVTFDLPEDLSTADDAAFDELARTLPLTIDKRRDRWVALETGMEVKPDGTLQLVPCNS